MKYACVVLAAAVLALGWLYRAELHRSAKAEAETVRLSKNMDTLRKGRDADNLVIAQAAEQSERMTTRARTLERRLREAMNGEADFDRVLSRNVTDALCLRYRSAAGVYGGDPAIAAGRTHAGTSDPVAGQCAHWAGMTLRDAVEWAGLLLDHAGLERLDKQALREWAAMGKRN